MKRFLSDPDRGRPKPDPFAFGDIDRPPEIDSVIEAQSLSYIEKERLDTEDVEDTTENAPPNGKGQTPEGAGRIVDIVLSDMSEPWEQTTGFWKKSLSNPHIRMMNTTGINFKDHAGSMV